MISPAQRGSTHCHEFAHRVSRINSSDTHARLLKDCAWATGCDMIGFQRQWVPSFVDNRQHGSIPFLDAWLDDSANIPCSADVIQIIPSVPSCLSANTVHVTEPILHPQSDIDLSEFNFSCPNVSEFTQRSRPENKHAPFAWRTKHVCISSSVNIRLHAPILQFHTLIPFSRNLLSTTSSIPLHTLGIALTSRVFQLSLGIWLFPVLYHRSEKCPSGWSIHKSFVVPAAIERYHSVNRFGPGQPLRPLHQSSL